MVGSCVVLVCLCVCLCGEVGWLVILVGIAGVKTYIKDNCWGEGG